MLAQAAPQVLSAQNPVDDNLLPFLQAATADSRLELISQLLK
jgi:hypothetical protein